MSLSLDGSVGLFGDTNGFISSTVTLTTTVAGVIVVAMILSPDGLNNGITVTSITDDAGLSYTQRSSISVNSDGKNFLNVWTAPSLGGHAANNITVNYSTTGCQFVTIHAFGIGGAATASYFDANGGLPVTDTTPAADPLSISTNNANDFIFATWRMAGTANPTAGGSWTEIFGSSNSGFMLSEYKIVSSTQSGLSATISTGAADSNAGIADAVKSATVADVLMGAMIIT